MVPKSFYDLRFGVLPGAARKSAHHICGSLHEAQAALDFELEASINVWLLFGYSSGADVALDVYQQGELAKSIDLHPFMTIRVEGYPDITFLGQGKPTGYADGSDDPGKVKMTIADGLSEGKYDDAFEVIVDWDSISVPPLVGEIAGYEDYVLLGDGPVDNLDELAGLDEDELLDELIERGYVDYGSHDFDA
ncbi:MULTISPECIES: hypothetical protein [unclassified Streptomyces]|uniref:hypothetical protein n=1 Tax=unclassified Streptomyces TaxID=2593676 RepID=UPI002DDA7036|nr:MULTISPECIES: hypothetical protein [unclassified Streptomyces]WSA90191.1 hypothetical protein OIE63_00570 [Streptomyces sp. NBC_01795]WSS17199.1 hypothetical protein OG533_38830 [Streptomyces sp. NBC_01186]WSS45943.1 hypothetical protein OG220_39080 [Streptomyces sp. NBC_01187]